MDARRIETALIGILTVIAVGAVMHLLKDVFIPLSLAALLSLMLTPFVYWLEKWRFPKSLAILFVMVVLFFILYAVGQLFYSSVMSFAEVFGGYMDRLNQILQEIWIKYEIPKEYFPEMGWTRTALDWLFQVSGSFVNFGKVLFLVLLFLVFMLAEATVTRIKFRRAFSGKISRKLSEAISDVTIQVGRYLLVKTFISIITGFSVWLALTIIGQDLAVLWGMLAFFLNFIPNLGSFAIMIATMTLGLVQFYPDWNRIAAVWITMPAIQMILGNFIDPQLQGDQLDLSPLVILVSLLFWGWIWGIIGMFLAVPFTVALKITMAHVPELKPIAILLGSGRMSRRFKRSWRTNVRKNRKEEK